MKFAQDKIVIDASMGANVTSSPILVDQIIGYALQCVYTGTPNGTLKIQISCDPCLLESQVTNWDDLSGSSVAISAAGITTYNVDMQYYKWFRVVFTRTSGSGVLNVAYNAKG